MPRFLLALFVALAVAPIAFAADLSPPSTPVDAAAAADSVRDYVSRRALLHIARATFDVVNAKDLPALVLADLRAATEGLTEADVARLDTDLIAEGSYFIVSLRYLIEGGYPAWPADRPAIIYSRDSLALLDPLPDRLVDMVMSGADPLPVFETASKVLLWTEGLGSPLGGPGDFSIRDGLVAGAYRALVSEAPKAAAT